MIDKIIRGVKRIHSRTTNHKKGWKTNRHIVVFESDDWGSIRMPNKAVYKKFIEEAYRVEKCHYMTYDSLESSDDLNSLFGVLGKYKDKNGNSPIFTANTIVANPSFPKIRETGFKEYHYETFLQTLVNYNYSSFDLWLEGIEKKVFYPQFHGREHLNVSRWLSLLQNGSRDFLFGFDNNMFGISKSVTKENSPSVMAALDADSINGVADLAAILSDGLSLFENIFKFKSKSFIAPNYVLPRELEATLAEKGVSYLQGGSLIKDIRGRSRSAYLGKRNPFDQIHLIRNCIFEPSVNQKINWAEKCFIEIDKSFKSNRPAIICSHRANYIGSIFEKNRNQSLTQLDALLKKIIKTWPSVEFFSSAELGDLISENE